MVKVFIEKEKKTKNIKASNVKFLLNKLKINPETVLIVKNNELTTIDSKIKPTDKIKLLNIVPGS